MTFLAWLYAHDSIVAALLGTVIGAVLGVGGSQVERWLRRREQARISSMLVATDLRHWMKSIVWKICDTQTSVSSGGMAGSAHTRIPDFRFEEKLDRIPLLRPGTAKKIFELIHAKDQANGEVEGTLEYQDRDDAIDLFRARSASLFLNALAIYDEISKVIGWREDVFLDSRLSMQAEVERYANIEKERVALNEKLWEGQTVSSV